MNDSDRDRDRDRDDDSPYLRKDVWKVWADGVKADIGKLYWFVGVVIVALLGLVTASMHGRL